MIMLLILLLIISLIYLLINLPYRNLFLLRAVIYAVIIFIIFQPSCVKKEFLPNKPAVAILADISESMALEQPSRYQHVKKILQDASFQNFIKRYPYFVYSFSEGIQPVSLSQLLNLSSMTGKTTNLASVLNETITENKEKNLSAIFLISDGANNSGEDPLLIAKKNKIPIYCFGAGGGEKQRDLSITRIETSEIAFKNVPTEVSAEIKAFGFDNQSITVNLFIKDELLASKKIKISSGKTEKVNFQFTPQRLGKFVYRVVIPDYPGELSVKNNQTAFLINVLRQKVRLLYLCGQPSWEYKFLRRLFKGDPRIEFVSFIILRNPDNISFVPENQLSLIPFPAAEIFTKQISNFDILFFENFSYERFFPSNYLDNVKKFVENGGSFVMLGGENSFGRGGYKGTAIEEILPVVLEGRQEKIDPARFRLQIAESEHPLLALADSGEESRKLWENMPELEGINCFGQAKKEAAVLASHPWIKNKNGNLPVIVAGQYKKGRVLTIASDTTWRWALNASPYQRFWQQAISWLLGSATGKQIDIVLPQEKILPGQEIRGKVNIFDQYYRPLSEATVKIFVVTPRGEKMPLEIFPEEDRYEFSYTAKEEGKYSFIASAWKNKKYLGEDNDSIYLSYPSGEQENPEFNQDLLINLAQVSGGEYFPIDQIDWKEIKLNRKTSPPVQEKKITVWDSVWIYLFLIVALAGEWFWRRSKGLW